MFFLYSFYLHHLTLTFCFFFNDTATTEIYTLSLHDALPISHRALIFGALTVGETRISGLLEGEDVINTANAMRALGARVERTGEGAWRVFGVGVGGFRAPDGVLDFGNSGTGCRLVMGAVGGCPISATFDGDASLRRRPMQRILEPLARIGARAADGSRLPITLAG